MTHDKSGQTPIHRNKYMEGARIQREKPLITSRGIISLIAVSFFVLVGFLYFLDDADLQSLFGQLGADILTALLLILLVITLGAGAGVLLAKLRALGGGGSSFSDQITEDHSARSGDDPKAD